MQALASQASVHDQLLLAAGEGDALGTLLVGELRFSLTRVLADLNSQSLCTRPSRHLLTILDVPSREQGRVRVNRS